ncbi:MAG: RNA 2',3'-cyclic phosphodiesterase [Acidimicrobiia bacterium]
MESVGRIFVAIGFPAEVRMAIAATASARLPGAIVPLENLHLTLRFLGDTSQLGLERLSAALDEASFPAPFVIRIGALGAFPNSTRASVVWLGVTGDGDDLAHLHEAVEESCVAAGFEPEERPFRPHVTLSRMRPPVDARSILTGTPSVDVSSRVDEVVVLRSHQGRRSPRYELLERFAL